MTDKTLDKSAFPRPHTNDQYRQDGMSLRDYFAAKALQALYGDAPSIRDAATEAYKVADAMLEAREQ